MSRIYSLSYLTASSLTPPQAVRVAAETGYREIGLRLLPNFPGGPQHHLIGLPDVLRETLAAIEETGVGVFDLEIIRIGAQFDPRDYLPFLEIGQALGARAVLVAGDDDNPSRLAENYARLCDVMLPFGLTADLEFMPWTPLHNAKTALRVVNDAGNPSNAGILVDALHFDRSDTTLDDLCAIPRNLLHYAQICDAPTASPSGAPFTVDEMVHAARLERLLPGEGGIDLAGMFDALPSDLPVSVELPHEKRMTARGQPGWSADALAASRALLERLHV